MRQNANLSVHTLTIAHRGVYRTRHDENTLEAHRLAATHPTLDGSECDVRFDNGRTLVVAHDDNLWKSRGLDVNVSDHSAKDLVNRFNTPTLQSVVQLFADRPLKTLVIDYKTPYHRTIDAIQQAEHLARDAHAQCSIMHLVWDAGHNLVDQNFRYPVYFAPSRPANVPAHLAALQDHGYTGVSLSYGQLVVLGDAVRLLLGAIARAELGVNLYGKLAHVEEMQRALANHCPGVPTSVTVDWPNLDV